MHVSICRCMKSTLSRMSRILCTMFRSPHLKTSLWMVSNVLQQWPSRLYRQWQSSYISLTLVPHWLYWQLCHCQGQPCSPLVHRSGDYISRPSSCIYAVDQIKDWVLTWATGEISCLIHFNVLYAIPDVLHYIRWSSTFWFEGSSSNLNAPTPTAVENGSTLIAVDTRRTKSTRCVSRIGQPWFRIVCLILIFFLFDPAHTTSWIQWPAEPDTSNNCDPISRGK